MAARVCISKSGDGEPCGAAPLKGDRYCFFHSPSTAVEREAAQLAGGKQRAKDRERTAPRGRVVPDAPDVELKSKAQVLQLIEDTVNRICRGELDANIAHQVGYLASITLKALENNETDERLKKLEEIARPLKGLTTEQLFELVRTARHVEHATDS